MQLENSRYVHVVANFSVVFHKPKNLIVQHIAVTSINIDNSSNNNNIKFSRQSRVAVVVMQGHGLVALAAAVTIAAMATVVMAIQGEHRLRAPD